MSNVDSLSLLYLWVKKVLWIFWALLYEVNDLNLFPLCSKFTDIRCVKAKILCIPEFQV